MSVQRIRVLHVIWAGGSGGAERFLLDITRYSDRFRFEHIACFLSAGGVMADAMRADGVEVRIIGMKNGMDLPGVWQFLRWFFKVKINVVHNHCRNFLVTLILLSFRRRPCIYSEHGGWLLAPSSHGPIFYNFLIRHHDLILANSDLLRAKILSAARGLSSKVEVLYIGIDRTLYKKDGAEDLRGRIGIPRENKVVGIVGRLVEAKGMDDFIRIAAEIRNNKVNKVSYVIVGSGILQRSLEELARELGVDVLFLGDRGDVPALLSIFDVFLFTSRWESFGIVLLEAMASGVPVVGFSTGGAVEIMARGGAVAVEGRDVKKAAKAAIDILQDPARAIALGEAGRRNVEDNFDIAKSIIKLQSVYTRFARVEVGNNN